MARTKKKSEKDLALDITTPYPSVKSISTIEPVMTPTEMLLAKLVEMQMQGMEVQKKILEKLDNVTEPERVVTKADVMVEKKKISVKKKFIYRIARGTMLHDSGQMTYETNDPDRFDTREEAEIEGNKRYRGLFQISTEVLYVPL